MTSFLRIREQSVAQNYLGCVLTWKERGATEFGRLLRATSSGMNVERLLRTSSGEFVPHPEPDFPASKGQITFSRDIRVVLPSVPLALVGAVMDAD
jgi:hypothetical protein